MKNNFLITLIVVCTMLFVFGVLNASATSTVNVSTVAELQSAHPYSSNMDKTWIYTHPTPAESLEITFSSDTVTEMRNDYIYIYDGDGNQIGKYNDIYLMGKTITVPGNVVKIRLTSNQSYEMYGFRVTSIKAYGVKAPIADFEGSVISGSSMMFFFSNPEGATSVSLEYSTNATNWTTAVTTEPLTADTTQATVIGLETGVTYRFRLNVVGGDREGISNVFSERIQYSPEQDFRFSNGTITKYIGDDTVVIIPETINGIAVTSIGDSAFSNYSELTSITIPKSVTTIGNDAFYNCKYLAEISWNARKVEDFLPDNGVFRGAGKSNSGINVIFGNSVEYIPAYIFDPYEDTPSVILSGNGAEVSSVYIGENVTGIGEYAFSQCTALTSVTVGEKVSYIGSNAFNDCYNLKRIDITDLGAWCNIDFKSSLANPLYYAEKLYLKGVLVTELVIPDNVNKITDYAFYNCTDLNLVEIPDSVTEIGDYAFYNCIDLNNITIGENVTTIGSSAFGNCEVLRKINWNAKNTADFSSYNNVFYNAGEYSYFGVNVVFGESVEKIPAYVFNPCNNSLYAPKITNVTIGENTTQIGDYAFSYCESLTKIEISDRVTNIGEGVFLDCTVLTNVIIPKSVKSIGMYAFERCSGLKDVYYKGSEYEWDLISKGNINDALTNAVLHFSNPKTETVLSNNDKSFTITPINIENGKTVILALYNGNVFVEMQSAVYTGEAVSFTTTNSYTNAKVMVWDDMTTLKPACKMEKLN